ncbi:MAG: adenylosuccinate synthetase [Phycisphaeraceae bacterium]|nr:adenylosuccinate synthetase [Phycisphaeraceae bacterium]
MRHRIVLLSGQVCAGKTTLAANLAARFDALHIKTRECIAALQRGVPAERGAMQAAGEQLDQQTNGAWVVSALQARLNELQDDGNRIVVLDAVRIPDQINAIRRGYGMGVIHIHLEAPTEVLEARYRTRTDSNMKELPDYSAVMENATERQVASLADLADVVISSERCTVEDVLLRAASHIGVFGRTYSRTVDVIVGGQYGSEGKGQIAAYLAEEYELLVRVGGPNAGHTVWEDPKPYTFHHLPSGTRRNPNARLAIGAGAVVRLPTLLREIGECQVEASRLSIDPQVMVISDEDVESESHLKAAMGSTGQGVGAATARRILDRHRRRSDVTLAENTEALRPFVRPVADALDRAFAGGEPVMLEGTQGTGLSLYHGRYPYVTSRDTTVAGCLAEAGISPSRVRKVLMVCRTYPIRVQDPEDGTSGPMSREISWETVAHRSGLPLDELQRVERTSTTHRRRRVGEFDWALLRSSASLNAPTDIALTFVDYLSVQNRTASRVEQLQEESLRFIEEVERVAAAPVSLLSVRFEYRAIIDRRRW